MLLFEMQKLKLGWNYYFSKIGVTVKGRTNQHCQQQRTKYLWKMFGYFTRNWHCSVYSSLLFILQILCLPINQQLLLALDTHSPQMRFIPPLLFGINNWPIVQQFKITGLLSHDWQYTAVITFSHQEFSESMSMQRKDLAQSYSQWEQHWEKLAVP